MNPVRQGLFDDATTLGANLGCIPGINPDNPTTSIPSFVAKHTQELSPGRITHTLRDVAAAKPFDVQVFDGDKIEFVDQSVRELVLKIPPLVGDVLMLFGNRMSQLSIALAALFCARPPVLSEGQLFFGGAKPTGVINLFACRQRSKKLKAHINADFGFAVGNKDGIGQGDLEDDMPVVQPVMLDDGLLDDAIVGDGAVLKDADVPDILDIKPAILQPKPIAVAEFERGEPPLAFEAGKPWILALFTSPEERLESLVQTAEDLLTGGIVQLAQTIRVILANIFQLVGLVAIVDRDFLKSPVIPSLLKSSVVKQAPLLNQKIKITNLLFGWIETKLVATFHRLLFWASMYLRIVSADTLPAVPM